MNQFLPIAAVIATCSFFLISAAPIDEANSRVDVIVVENVTDYLKTAPEVFDLVRLEKTNLTRTQIRYTAGRRVGGDRVVASNVGNQSWGVAQDVALTLAYPANGVGAIVSYIEIIVNQVIPYYSCVIDCWM